MKTIIKLAYEEEAALIHATLVLAIQQLPIEMLMQIKLIQPNIKIIQTPVIPGTLFLVDTQTRKIIGHTAFIVLEDCPDTIKITTVYVDEEYRRRGLIKDCINFILEYMETVQKKPYALLSDIDGESDNFYQLLVNMTARTLQEKNALDLPVLAYSINHKFNYSTLTPRTPNDLRFIFNRSMKNIQECSALLG